MRISYTWGIAGKTRITKKDFSLAHLAPKPDQTLTLIRRATPGGESWATVKGGKLPAEFLDKHGEVVGKVPSSFHDELRDFLSA